MTAVAAVFGAVWGSFFDVCIARIPAGLSIVRPGSRCGSCGMPIRPSDNIPIVSYFLLRGRCRACKQPFSPRYPLVEALAGLIAAALWITFVAGDPGEAVAIRIARFAVYFAFSGVLIVLSFIDFATHAPARRDHAARDPDFLPFRFRDPPRALAAPADRRRGRLPVPAHHCGLLLLRAQA